MEKQQISFEGARKRKIHLDFYHNPKIVSKALVLFVHGFKGFKDWGPWELMSEYFVQAGYAILFTSSAIMLSPTIFFSMPIGT